MRHIKALAIAVGVSLAAVAFTAPTPAEAGKRNFSLYVGPGGFGLHVGPRYRYRRHYYKRRHYGPRFYGYYPRYYKRRYYKTRRYGRCSYKARACARSWGYGNRNWRGCMRYYGCR